MCQKQWIMYERVWRIISYLTQKLSARSPVHHPGPLLSEENDWEREKVSITKNPEGVVGISSFKKVQSWYF